MQRATALALLGLSALVLLPGSSSFSISPLAPPSSTSPLSTRAPPFAALGAPLLRSPHQTQGFPVLRMAEEGKESKEEEEAAPEAAAEEAAAEEEAPEEDPFAGLALDSPEFLKRKIEILEKELSDAQADTASLDDLVKRNILKTSSAAELKDTYIRLAADFENFRRRSATDLTNAKNAALTSVLKDMVTVLDNFELAAANVKPETDKEESIKSSYDALGKQLTNSLTKLGVVAIDPLGEEFNPMLHDAIQQAESTEYAEGKVCQALQRGYKVGEQTLRAAVVVVSAGPGPEGGEEPAKEEAAAEE
uniref:GrpE protein homolog n=1 Tax=Hemiselmis tepida TaxID=464990 RepID=A0A7S0WJE9_9CRYP|mmetsp:Transcript_974/g.2437  ORF Transcript_974/g.2437 Transcript_974/m.2437 type:complete len:306 (+) Transcript_974:61-978(+)